MINKYLFFCAVVLFLPAIVACRKDYFQDDPWASLPKPESPDKEEQVDGVKELEDADNIVVAHRGGSLEAGKQVYPDNSVASLRYAISLGCYASEADIYWTKDNNVIVAHADSECKINGVHPWEHDIEYIRSLGRLSNGETIPTLEEYIEVLLKESKCTRLWLDIKNITYPKVMSDEATKSCIRACEIITEMKANKIVEFICTGNAEVMSKCSPVCFSSDIPIAWMSNRSPAEYRALGYSWANLSQDYFDDGFHGGTRTVEEFKKAKITLSVYTVDKEEHMNYFIARKSDLKAISTNYPAKLLGKMK